MREQWTDTRNERYIAERYETKPHRSDGGGVAWQRKHYAMLRCPETGKAAIVDLFVKRLSLMRQAIAAWIEDVERYRASVPNSTRLVMVMLTYRRSIDYQPGHIRDYLKKIKQSLGSNLLTFAWVAELQGRGAIHYHLLVLVKRGSNFPMPDKSGMWRHGWSGIRTARIPWYLIKYVGKEYQKDLARYPKSCRLYGVSPRPYFSLNLTTPDGVVVGALEHGKPVKSVRDPDQPKWEYVGSSVTRGYAEEVLLQSGDVLK